jgi:hypothetical protein
VISHKFNGFVPEFVNVIKSRRGRKRTLVCSLSRCSASQLFVCRTVTEENPPQFGSGVAGGGFIRELKPLENVTGFGWGQDQDQKS